MSAAQTQKGAQKGFLLAGGVLLAALAVMWTVFNQSGWSAPAPRSPNYKEALADLGGPGYLATADYDVLLTAPLFEENRTPPSAAPAPEVKTAAPVEPTATPGALDDVKLLGIYGGRQGAGTVIVRANGKERRLRVGDELEGWTLQAIDGRQVRFSRTGEEPQTLELKRPTQITAEPIDPQRSRAALGRGG